MPAAAVIPTPGVPIVDAAVKKSVVDGTIKGCVIKRTEFVNCSGADREHGIGWRRMKSQDPTWTN